jgi:gliding motility-associated-like protein
MPSPAVSGYDTLVRMNIPYTITPVYGQDAVKWNWVPADSLSCSDCPNPVFVSRTDKTYLVYVSNSLGCTSVDTVTVRVFCDGASVTMPNAFTPNNDGHNDLYYVRGQGFSVKRFIIYNRLGQEVFHKENFLPNDRSYGWDGTMNGAAISEAAGFVYLLEVACFNSGYEPMVMKGTVLLIR